MDLLDILNSKAAERGLLDSDHKINAETVFYLVRDMPYKRASDTEPETIINEWRGTCSGKHYLLKALYQELGRQAKIMACTNETIIDVNGLPAEVREQLKIGAGRFVDVHNYLVLETPEGEMIVDATWPITAKSKGLPVNEKFVLGVDQIIACQPIETWVVPEGVDPQTFKQKLLEDNYNEDELEDREILIRVVSEWLR